MVRKSLLITLALLFCLPSASLMAQTAAGLWSLGVRGGGSLWLSQSKYDQKKFGPGADLLLRYNTGSRFTLGLSAGFEELKAGSNQFIQPGDNVYGITYNYLKFTAIPAALVVTYSFTDGPVSPYIYFGGGVVAFQRRANQNSYVPDNKFHFSPFVPIGLGLEAFLGRQISFVVEGGIHGANNRLDILGSKSPLAAVTGRVGLNFYFGTSDEGDDDHDGLSNAEERRYGTDPHNPDTDGDGLSDGLEVKKYHTNPLKKDTDGDGLSDADEVLKYRTDPLKFDTDGDGLSDGDEVLKYHTDPLKWDTDGDGLSDGDEVLKYHTDPLKVDTDGDGLSDWEEVMIYHTDPLKSDTDGDGLSDSEEVKKYKTDPLKPDTDGGGVPDGVEVKRGTNPLDPRDDMGGAGVKLEHGKKLVLEGVNFESGTARLTTSSEETLSRVLQVLRDNPDVSVEVAGYTDNIGKASTNFALSRRRADVVRTWLIEHGINALRLTARGYGAEDPIAPNSTVLGRAQNRRIEFHVQ
jgi:outer membrane protein OmpA-like peptidoglycan-associated protein